MLIEDSPLAIYLDTPIVIKGIKVSHTKEGLEFLLNHYVNMPRKEKLAQSDLQHMERLIANFKISLDLYESIEPIK